MSFNFNYKFWVGTKKDLDDLQKRQAAIAKLKPDKDKLLNHTIFAELYVQYKLLVDKLGYIYHHTFQVQKRDIVKNLVEAATKRLLELKNELKNLELSEFIYVDKSIIRKRVTPYDVEIFTPKYFPFWRPLNVQETIYGPRKPISEEDVSPTLLKKLLAQREAQAAAAAEAGETATKVEKPRPKRFEAPEEVIDPVKLRTQLTMTFIQKHERARQARVYLTNIRTKPEIYKPTINDSKYLVKYVFTHKPNQVMLFPVKRTRFEANYFLSKKDLTDFKYYVKPVFVEDKVIVEDKISGAGEEEEEFDEMEEISLPSTQSDFIEEHDSVESLRDQLLRMTNLAATKIQSYWKAYKARQKYKKILERKAIIYGMASEFRPKTIKARICDDRDKEAMRHRLLKEKLDEEFIRFCEDERARIYRVRSPWIMEDISDMIRAWFKLFYDKLKAFHPYPQIVKGGTLLLVTDALPTYQEYAQIMKKPPPSKEELKKQKEKAKAEKRKIKRRQQQEKKMLAKYRAKLKKAGMVDFRDNMLQSKAVKAIEDTIQKYKVEWKDIDEKLNKKHEIIKEWLTSQYYCEIHQELHGIVDQLMFIEYELLRSALAKDMKQRYRKGKMKLPKPKKQKKQKKKPDMTAHRSIESLFYELQDAGIIKLHKRKTFQYFIGERNHCAYDLLQLKAINAPPYKGEIKDILSEYILGMGPLNITKPKAVCLAGPPHSSKTLLCECFASEIDAVVFDLDPVNVVKFKDEMKYFIHILTKMAKILEPSVFFIKNIHRVFWKKIPPEFLDISPKLLQSQLKKHILKAIKKDDKVFFLATTDAPWEASGKMKSLFQKMLLVPNTEYATSFFLRKCATLQYPGIPRDFNFSPLALVTKAYPTGDLVKSVEETLSVRRRMQLSWRPLDHVEFIDYFLEKDPKYFPPELKAWEKFAKWYRKVNKMERKRLADLKKRAETIAKLEAAAAKKKNRK